MNLATGALGGGGKFSPIISKSFYSKCTCTKCGIEFNTILPNSNDVWLDSILCDDCFDKWLMTQNKNYLKRSF